MAAGVGQRSLRLGGFPGGVGAAPLPCPLAGLIHLLCGKRSGLGGPFGLQPGELPREAFCLFAQPLLSAAKPLQFAIARLFVFLLGVGLDLFLQLLLPLFQGR